MPKQLCRSECAGYTYYGMQNGNEVRMHFKTNVIAVGIGRPAPHDFALGLRPYYLVMIHIFGPGVFRRDASKYRWVYCLFPAAPAITANKGRWKCPA